MTPGRARQAELRQRRLKQGLRQVTVWLDQASLDRLAAVRQPGDHDSDVIRRALQVLAAQETAGHLVVTSDAPQEPAAVTSDRTPKFASDVTSDTPVSPAATNGPPEIPAKDAPLVALLRQTDPPLTYAEVAARLGISVDQVKKKAAPWAKAGLVPQRPRGGARPRKGAP